MAPEDIKNEKLLNQIRQVKLMSLLCGIDLINSQYQLNRADVDQPLLHQLKLKRMLIDISCRYLFLESKKGAFHTYIFLLATSFTIINQFRFRYQKANTERFQSIRVTIEFDQLKYQKVKFSYFSSNFVQCGKYF